MIAGVLVLNWKGVTTMLSSAVLVVVGYYFAEKVPRANTSPESRGLKVKSVLAAREAIEVKNNYGAARPFLTARHVTRAVLA